METVRILGSLIGISKLNNFKEINTELIPVIEKDICNPEFRNKYYESHKTGYAFTSDKAGTIDISNATISSTINAISGDNTITFNTLDDGTYNNIFILILCCVLLYKRK